MAKFVFKGNLHHDAQKFVKGQECPKDLHDLMLGKGLIEALPEPKPVEPPKQAQAPHGK